jgi:hypothetical protein
LCRNKKVVGRNKKVVGTLRCAVTAKSRTVHQSASDEPSTTGTSRETGLNRVTRETNTRLVMTARLSEMAISEKSPYAKAKTHDIGRGNASLGDNTLTTNYP